MKKLFRFFAGYKRDMVTAPLFKLLESLTELIIPYIVANMIDIGVKNHDVKYIAIFGAVVVALNIVGIVCAVFCQKFSARASAGIAYEMRKSLYAHINTFSHQELDKFGTATLNNRITHDVSRVRQAISGFLRLVMRAPFMLIGSIIMAMIIDLKLSLLFLVVAPLVTCVVVLILKITEPLYDKSQKNLDKVSEITRENLQGTRVVRAFNKQSHEEERFQAASLKLRKSSTKVTNISALMMPLTGTIINFAIIAVIWFGGLQVNSGILTQGQIIAFVNYLTQLSMALISIANYTVAFIKASNCAKRINEVFDTHPSVSETNHDPLNIIQDKKVPKVEFRNVSFAYSGAAKNAVNNLNLVVMPGQTIGIIGGTGSGKSSIVNLIPRFYDATEGSVYIDGVDVKNYSFHELRSKMGIVPQKAVLFKGSLRENLKWRKRDATAEEITKAIKISQSDEFVNELSGKYDYRIQAGGKNLSGGQRQRLTIARALVGDPEILILDDSASALDFATDASLRKAIKNDIDSTVFLVSQRANTVKNADQIVVLENGNIVGIGKHKELIDSCPVYKEIYDSQTK